MLQFGEMAFVGAARDRRHDLRHDAAAQEALWQEAQVVVLWQGRLLFSAEGIGLRTSEDPILGEGAGLEPLRIYLGTHEQKPVFAADISGWQPEEGVPVENGFAASGQLHPRAPQGWRFDELRGRMADLTPAEAEMAATARALVEWHRGARFCPRCGGVTRAGGGGWHRKCDSCNATHFPRTDPCVIMLVTRGNETLLGRSPGWPEGMYSTLAGFIEPGETIEAAVRREVMEETGIPCGSVRYIASQPWPFPASLMLGCHAEAEAGPITLDKDELEDAFWITREALVEVMAGRHPTVRGPRRGSIAQFLLANWLADRLDVGEACAPTAMDDQDAR